MFRILKRFDSLHPFIFIRNISVKQLPPISGPKYHLRPYLHKVKTAAYPVSAFAAPVSAFSAGATESETVPKQTNPIRKDFPENWIWETIEK